MGELLGARIRHLRERQNLSQKELAIHLDISNVQLSRYESGARTPDLDIIRSIATFFNVSSDYLLGLNGSINESKVTYISDEDIMFIHDIKKVKGLEAFIKTAIKNPETFEKVRQIFDILRST